MMAASRASVLPSPPIHAGCSVHHPAGDVEQRLAGVDQQRDRESGAAGVEVDRPGLDLAQRGDVGDHLRQRRFVVQDPAGEQPPALTVDHHAVVVGLPSVDPGPDLSHLTSPCSDGRSVSFPSRRLARRVLTQRSDVALPNQRSGSSRHSGRPFPRGHTSGTSTEAIPGVLWGARTTLRPGATRSLIKDGKEARRGGSLRVAAREPATLEERHQVVRHLATNTSRAGGGAGRSGSSPALR